MWCPFLLDEGSIYNFVHFENFWWLFVLLLLFFTAMRMSVKMSVCAAVLTMCSNLNMDRGYLRRIVGVCIAWTLTNDWCLVLQSQHFRWSHKKTTMEFSWNMNAVFDINMYYHQSLVTFISFLYLVLSPKTYVYFRIWSDLFLFTVTVEGGKD